MINLTLSFTNANQFIKFNTYNNLTVSNRSQAFLKLKNGFQVSKYTPDKSCMLACSATSDCAVATIEENICTFFNNKTLLINTIYSNKTQLLSKNQLKECFDGYYANFTDMVCQVKKLNGKFCVSMEECMSSAGLECFNKICQCMLPDFK